MDDFEDPDQIEKIESQSGLPASAKGWVGYVGGLIGLAIALCLFYFIVGHRTEISSQVSADQQGKHATSFPIDIKGLATPTKVNYVYRVVGPRGTTARITYANQDGTTGEVLRATLQWSVATTTSDGSGLPADAGVPPYIGIQLNTHGATATVTCQAIDRGRLEDQETSTGVDLFLSCGVPL